MLSNTPVQRVLCHSLWPKRLIGLTAAFVFSVPRQEDRQRCENISAELRVQIIKLVRVVTAVDHSFLEVSGNLKDHVVKCCNRLGIRTGQLLERDIDIEQLGSMSFL